MHDEDEEDEKLLEIEEEIKRLEFLKRQKKKAKLLKRQARENARLAREEQELQERMEKEVCAICCDTLFNGDDDVIELENCKETYHSVCVREYLLTQIDANHFPIYCPNHECKALIIEKNLESLLEPVDFKRYDGIYKAWIKSNLPKEFLAECPNPSCDYFCEKEEGETFFTCRACQVPSCLECKVPYHYDMTCKEAKLERMSRIHTRED